MLFAGFTRSSRHANSARSQGVSMFSSPRLVRCASATASSGAFSRFTPSPGLESSVLLPSAKLRIAYKHWGDPASTKKAIGFHGESATSACRTSFALRLLWFVVVYAPGWLDNASSTCSQCANRWRCCRGLSLAAAPLGQLRWSWFPMQPADSCD